MTRLLHRIKWVWVLIGWTVFLWVSRTRNVINNDELTTSGRTIRIAIAVLFIVLAAATAVAVRKRKPQMIVGFLTWTVGYWLIRGVGILIDGDYSVSFRAIHTVLMVVSLTLSGLTARQLRLGR